MSTWGYTHDKGGYYFDSRAERRSWVELDDTLYESALEDATRWYKRLKSHPRSLHDASVGTVRLHVGSLLGYIDRLKGALDKFQHSVV